ncbi:MAG: glycosyltransferase [Pseudomonadota bacterium]
MSRLQVAVIIICCDLGRYLEQAVKSVLEQTQPPAELLIVDDGSTDLCTKEVLLQMEQLGHRVLRTTNRGVSAARNFGISQTTSPLLVLLDADDVLEPPYLEKAAIHLGEESEYDFVSCAVHSFGAADFVWTPVQPDLIRSIAFGTVHVSSMFRRQVWQTVGGFEEATEVFEDLDFWTSALEQGFKGYVLEEPLLRCRVRPDSRYRWTIQPERYLRIMNHFYQKHWDTVSKRTEEILLEKEAFLLEQKAHHSWLSNQSLALEKELASVNEKIERAHKTLQLLDETSPTQLMSDRVSKDQNVGAILLYHRITTNNRSSRKWSVTRENFRAQMEFMRKHYRLLPLADLAELATKGEVPDRAIAITFDDGYLSALTVASDILTKLKIPATYFVTTADLDSKHEFAWDTLERIFLSSNSLPGHLILELPFCQVEFSTTKVNERRTVSSKLMEIIYPLPAEKRNELMETVVRWSRQKLLPRDSHRLLLRDEIRRLAHLPGVTIGAHSQHHSCLPLQPREVQQAEINGSKNMLEDLLDRPISTFAYPFGEYSEQTVSLVREAGFKVAVTVKPEPVVSFSYPLLLPRLEVPDIGKSRFSHWLKEMFDQSSVAVDGLSRPVKNISGRIPDKC